MPRISPFPTPIRHFNLTAIGVVFMLLFNFDPFAQASSAKASCKVLLQFYETRLTQDFNFKAAPQAVTCDSVFMKTVEAFYFVHQISGALQAKGTNQNFYEWIKARFKTIEFAREFIAPDENSNVTIVKKEASGSSQATNLAIASADRNGTLTIYNRFYTRSLIRRTGTLIHEARHMDADAPTHVICKKGPLAGTFSCDLADQADTTGGAYVHEALFWSMVLNLGADVFPKYAVVKELRFIQRAHLASPQATTRPTDLAAWPN